MKKNQPTLLRQAQTCALRETPLSEHREEDSSHGRQVERRVRVYAAPPEAKQKWTGLAVFVRVERRGIRDGKSFQREGWFIASAELPAERMGKMIRGHRGAIENRLHWVKDVVQGEDGAMLREAGPAAVMATLRSWAITVYRHVGEGSITRAVRRYGHDLKTLLSFL